ncbi:hypothetical protein LX92_03050 [Maribacter polysiphoniae]|uniref:Uncharacterized protein n=1 Tax=Maribacter polysiphoniae TaxID=429344 RepID=A0A316DXE6_9FLAO|nr:hypothetical protein LX92_03050 [Maribacter polysiphoniae]
MLIVGNLLNSATLILLFFCIEISHSGVIDRINSKGVIANFK